MTVYDSTLFPDSGKTYVHFLLRFFQDFYYEMLRQKERVLSGRGRLALPNHAPTGTEVAPQTTTAIDEEAESILKILENILEEQSIEASEEGGTFGVACYKEAQYIMAALADEVFLSLSWEGRKYWEANLLEERLFKTHVAGERFFKNLENFLQERDSLKRELGILYLTALGLGFRGQYRGFNDQGSIEKYREQLFVLVYHHKPSLFDGNELLCPSATRNTLSGSVPQNNKDVRRWTLAFLGCLSGYLLISYGIWYGATHSLSKATNSILEDARTLT